jgi:hypothetical protein
MARKIKENIKSKVNHSMNLVLFSRPLSREFCAVTLRNCNLEFVQTCCKWTGRRESGAGALLAHAKAAKARKTMTTRRSMRTSERMG